MMDRKFVFACLALLVVAEVQSYTLRDALRNRLRERELNRLREFDMFDTNPVSDEAQGLRVLNKLREFHLNQMLLDEALGNDKECKDERPAEQCEAAKSLGHCEEIGHIKEWVDENCRRTCNVKNCRGSAAANIKPPAQARPTCTDVFPVDECDKYKEFCNHEEHLAIALFLNRKCYKTCNYSVKYGGCIPPNKSD